MTSPRPIIVTLLVVMFATASTTAETPTLLRGVRALTPSTHPTLTQPCRLFQRHIQKDDHTFEHPWFCEVLSSIDRQATDGLEFILVIGLTEDLARRENIMSGFSTVWSPTAPMVDGTLNIENHLDRLELTLDDADFSNARRLAGVKTLGVRSVLVIRVATNAGGSVTSTPKTQLANAIFGTLGDEYNLKTWFDRCSHGLLQFEPYEGTFNGESITGGVMDVSINAANGLGAEYVHQLMMDAVEAALGIANLEHESAATLGIDHFMFVLPPNTSGTWAAWADLDGHISVFNDLHGTYPTYQLHEMGHNLGA